MGTSVADMRDFFLGERGLTQDTLDAWGVTVDGATATFPYTSGIKGRRHDPDGKRHFWFVEGDASGLFLSPPVDDGEVVRDMAFLCEGETDAMRLWQETSGEFPVAGLSGINSWREEMAEVFDEFETVWVILDNDEDYKVSGIVDATWRQVRKDLGSKAVRLRLPTSPIRAKDVCEFFDFYDLEALRQIAEEQPVGEEFYKPLDMTKPAPATTWLVDRMVAKHDVSMWIGEPQVGKSWLTMALAVAVANGDDTFLGKPLDPGGCRVLYVDEENPEDVVRQRLQKLGLKAPENLRFLHQQSIRLDKHPERLIDQAMDYGPDLIVLDSLTRLHAGDENNAGFIAGLFNEGINPLVRATGAALVMLHHVNKSDGTSAFGRARGSSDIVGSIDAGWDITKAGQHLHLSPFKSRRVAQGGILVAEILDNAKGGVDIVTRNRTVF